MKTIIIFLNLIFLVSAFGYADELDKTSFDQKVNVVLKSQYHRYEKDEYFSGIGVAISLPNKPIKTFTIGRVSHNKNSAKISSNSLFEIGSISKSFTAALILKLVAAKQLKLTDKVQQFLPKYKKWGNITIEQLLNMTSGLPNYSDSPAWNYLESQDIFRHWSDQELLSFVYPSSALNPPLKTGYYYTNTGYIIAGLILEKITHKSYRELLQQEIFSLLNLRQTYYMIGNKDSKEYQSLVHGYGYNQYANPRLVGRDLKNNNLSWAGPAGGLVASLKDVAIWVRHLFNDKTFLTVQARNALTKMVSTKTGKPISKTSSKDPQGFALGVTQKYIPAIGNFWFYQGETLGFRTLYMYVPCNGVIIVASFNSATNSENNHAHELLVKLYQLIMKAYPEYQCIHQQFHKQKLL